MAFLFLNARRLIGAIALIAALSSIMTSTQAAELKKVNLALGSTSFAWFSIYVTHGAGFFEEEGLDVNIISVSANQTPVAAILSGGADIAGIGVQASFAARDKKLPVKLLAPVAEAYTSTMFIRKETAARLGISRESPIEDRVRALKGLKLATTAIGAGPHLMYKFLFAKYGMDADKDATVVPVGNSQATLAAMSKGVVDVSCFSPPVPQKAIADGYAETLIDFINGDVPETLGMVYTALAISEKKLQDDPKMLAAFLRALDKGGKLAHSDKKRAGEAAKKFMKGLDSKLYSEAVDAIIGSVPTSVETPIDGLEKYMVILKGGGYKYDIDFNDLVINDFVKKSLANKM
ncbi:ABC transporter substrate-binding protein [Sneathiella sp.]|uniref:ABC transporter substrate-binding protein n=1 Tax=Sneathiella sp. TaxID=1964365 RepID=UPI003561F1EB